MKSKYVVITVFFFLLCVKAYGIEVSVSEVTADPGTTVTVAISVDTAVGIAGGNITLEYDSNILTAKEAQPTDLVKGLLPITNINIPGMVKFAMAAISGLKEGSGEIFRIDFEVKADAEGTSPLTLSEVALFDELGGDIAVTIKNGSVTVKKAPCTTPIIREYSPGSKILALQATYNQANVHGHTYIDIWEKDSLLFIPEPGQYLEFQVAMFSGNPAFKGTVDLIMTDGTTLRDSGAKDQNGISAHPAADLSKYARDHWYHRKISLDVLAGKTLAGAMIATDSNEHKAGLFRAYVDNIQITDGECVLLSIYKDEDVIPITGKATATGTTFAGTTGMSDYSVSIVGETPVTPAGKLTTTWGKIKNER